MNRLLLTVFGPCILAIAFTAVALPVSAQWLGTDLSYSCTKGDCLEIELNSYYLPGSEKAIPKTQGVSFFEAKNGPPRIDFQLNLLEIKTVEGKKKLSCFPDETGNYLKAIYKATATLHSIDGGYNLVWNTILSDREPYQNISDLDIQGLSLVCSVPSVLNIPDNHLAILSDPPAFNICPNEKFLAFFGYSDPENDSLKFSFNEINTTVSLLYPKPAPMLGAKKAESAEVSYPQDAPPYKKLNYASGYTADKPFGKDGLLNNKSTKLMTFKISKPGNYLAAMSLTETRGKIKTGEIQRVYRMGVGTILPKLGSK